MGSFLNILRNRERVEKNVHNLCKRNKYKGLFFCEI